MLVNFLQNLTIVNDPTVPANIFSDPMPIASPSLNRVGLTCVVHHAVAIGSTTFSLDMFMQGSNDGDNWFDVVTMTPITGATAEDAAGDFNFAFCRVRARLTVTGTDWASVTFDVHGNFVAA